MSPRTGRPQVDTPKDIRFSIRIDKETNEKLDKFCTESGIAKAEAIRQGIHLLLAQKNRTNGHFSLATNPNVPLYQKLPSTKYYIVYGNFFQVYKF